MVGGTGVPVTFCAKDLSAIFLWELPWITVCQGPFLPMEHVVSLRSFCTASHHALTCLAKRSCFF